MFWKIIFNNRLVLKIVINIDIKVRGYCIDLSPVTQKTPLGNSIYHNWFFSIMGDKVHCCLVTAPVGNGMTSQTTARLGYPLRQKLGHFFLVEELHFSSLLSFLSDSNSSVVTRGYFQKEHKILLPTHTVQIKGTNLPSSCHHLAFHIFLLLEYFRCLKMWAIS